VGSERRVGETHHFPAPEVFAGTLQRGGRWGNPNLRGDEAVVVAEQSSHGGFHPPYSLIGNGGFRPPYAL